MLLDAPLYEAGPLNQLRFSEHYFTGNIYCSKGKKKKQPRSLNVTVFQQKYFPAEKVGHENDFHTEA